MGEIFKKLSLIMVIASCGLLYVALQTEIYKVSYSIHDNREVLKKTQDSVEKVRNRVMKLKTLDSIEAKMELSEIPLILPNEVRTVEVMPLNPQILPDPSLASEKSSFSIFSLVREAYAKIALPESR